MSIVCVHVKNLESCLRASYTKRIQRNVACLFMTSHFLLSTAKATISWTWNKFCLNWISWLSVIVSKAQRIASAENFGFKMCSNMREKYRVTEAVVEFVNS